MGKEVIVPIFFQVEFTPEERQVLQPYMKVDADMHAFFANKLEEKINAFGIAKMDQYLRQLEHIKDYVSEKCGIAESKKGVVFKTEEE